MRVGQGPIRRIVANCPLEYGRSLIQRHKRRNSASDRGGSKNEKFRSSGPRGSTLRAVINDCSPPEQPARWGL